MKIIDNYQARRKRNIDSCPEPGKRFTTPVYKCLRLGQHHLRLLRYLGIDAGPVDLGVDPVAAGRMGLSASDVSAQLSAAWLGEVAMQELKDKRVLVAGLGRFGGGIAVSRWLVEQGAHVMVTDQASTEALAQSCKQLHGLPIEYRLGEHREEDFTSVTVTVPLPRKESGRRRSFSFSISSAMRPAL